MRLGPPPIPRLRLAERAADYAYVLARQAESVVSSTEADDLASPRRGPLRCDVLLLPGVYETWHVMAPLARALHAAGHPVHVAPALRRSGAPVADLARRVAAMLDERDLRQVVCVAHSKGGLVGKTLMAAEAAEADLVPPRVRGLVAVATPWAGSRYAALFAVPAIRSLRPSDAAILALAREVAVDARIVAIRPTWDPHIPDPTPPPAAREVVLDVTGHFRILGEPVVHDAVLEAVAALP